MAALMITITRIMYRLEKTKLSSTLQIISFVVKAKKMGSGQNVRNIWGNILHTQGGYHCAWSDGNIIEKLDFGMKFLTHLQSVLLYTEYGYIIWA